MGASLESGLGFQLPNTPTGAIQNVNGGYLTENFINVSTNGTEAGQTKAVFIAFDNVLKTFSDVTGNNPTGNAGINTSMGGRTGTPDTIRMVIDFINPLNAAAVGQAPYNPFMFSGLNRGNEIHLPDFQPTDLADYSLFGIRDDNSQPTTGRYYKSETNLPWVINVVDSFDHTIEKVQINSGYNYFNTWAVTSGSQNKDWFKNNNGFRIESNIFAIQ